MGRFGAAATAVAGGWWLACAAAAPAAAAGPDLSAVRAELAGVPCVAATAEAAGGGAVRLGGTAGARELAEEAARAAAATPGVTRVANAIEVVPAPGCHAAVRVLRAVGPPLAGAPTLVLNRADGVYVDGDHLTVEVTMPSGFGGSLYVDVVTDADTVYHLLPEPMRPGNDLPAGGRLRVGVEAGERAPDVRHWVAGPPHGAGYVLAVASERPLPEGGPRPVQEPLPAYLPGLLAAIADPATGGKGARVKRIEFRPKR